MREPVDEFAECLRALRTRGGLGAGKLSAALGLSVNYIGQWERGGAKTINLSVLHKVCDLLDLSGAEERELFQLAELRNSEGKANPRTGNEPELNLTEALMGVDQHKNAPGFDAPPVESELTSSFVEAASWLLAYWAIRCGRDSFDYRQLGVGEEFRNVLVEKGISKKPSKQGVRDSLTGKSKPPRMSQVERETLKHPELQAMLVGNCIASAYRKWLFQRLERCRDCASRLAFWALFRTPMEPVATFQFKEASDHDMSVLAVSCDVIAKVNQRRMAAYITSQDNTTGDFIHVQDKVDTWPRTLAAWSKHRLDELCDKKLSRVALLGHAQIIADSIYTLIDQQTWDAKWWVRDWHPPFFTMPGSKSRELNLQHEEDREELIHRLKRVQRRIQKLLKSKKGTGASEGFPRDQESEWDAFRAGL